MGGYEDDRLYCLLKAAIIDLKNSNQDVAAFTNIAYMLRNSVDAGILDKFSDYSYSSMLKFRSRTRRILCMDVIVETDRLLLQQILEQKKTAYAKSVSPFCPCPDSYSRSMLYGRPYTERQNAYSPSGAFQPHFQRLYRQLLPALFLLH